MKTLKISLNKKIGIALVATWFICFTSCNQFELEPNFDSEVAFDDLKTKEDIIKVVTPIYKQYGSRWSQPHVLGVTTYGADDITTWAAGNKSPMRVYDKFEYGDGENSDNLEMLRTWSGLWQVIYYANSAIKGLKTATAPADAVNMADGEARFFRAMTYFFIVRVWGNVPVILDTQTPDGKETRAPSVLVNYEHIEDDFLIAIEKLPAPSEVSAAGKVSSAAAKIALADFYLTWAGWPVKDESKYALAADYAKQVIDLGYFELLPIDKLWLKENQNSRESIFSVQFSETEDYRNGAPYATAFHEARGWSDFFPERQFFFDFPEGPRKDYTFYTEIPQRKWNASIGQIVYNDPPSKPWQKSQRNHPMYRKFDISSETINSRVISYRAREIFRYAEVLLIYAEAQARAGGIDQSVLDAYNQVRRRAAGLPFDVPAPTIDVENLTIDDIVAEKGWELAGEMKRWWDLVRLEKVAEAANRRDPTEEVELVKSLSEIGWKQYISPIPQSEIDRSAGILVQNPEGFIIQ